MRMTSPLRTPCITASTAAKSRPPGREAAPVPLDDGARIDERAVEVEQQRWRERVLTRGSVRHRAPRRRRSLDIAEVVTVGVHRQRSPAGTRTSSTSCMASRRSGRCAWLL
jgi:hypothetical protein